MSEVQELVDFLSPTANRAVSASACVQMQSKPAQPSHCTVPCVMCPLQAVERRWQQHSCAYTDAHA